MPIKKTYLALSIALVLMLCAAQIFGSMILILPCLAAFMVLVGWSCTDNYTLPILLFFLPWSPILRMSPTGYSFFTFGLVLVCGISIIKKGFRFKKYSIVTGIILMFLTLIAKVMDGSSLTFDYIAFLMLIVLFPVVKGEWTVKKYDFFQVAVFFSVGVVIAALCALNLVVFPNIAKYIRVDAFLTVTRRSGFYGDANFYTAQITAALGGCLVLILREKQKSHVVFLGIMLVLLLYSGLLSASKSFVLVSVGLAVLWIIAFLRMRGRAGLKVILLISIIVVTVFVATSALFGELIEVVRTRFSYANDLNSFTTGRLGLWESYFQEIWGNVKIFFLGKGFTNVKVNGRASHNTLIQAFFQFGFLGLPFLVYWIVSFFKGASYKGSRKHQSVLEAWIVAVGIFMPWIAIDALFFDEFFLLQWYMFSIVQQMKYEDAVQRIRVEDSYG